MRKILWFMLCCPSYPMHNSVTPLPDPDDIVAQRAYTAYFRNDESQHSDEIKSFIKEVIKEKREATPPLQRISILNRLENGDTIHTGSVELNEIVVKAIDKAFEHHHQESKKKWSKMQAASLTAGATLISSGITLTVFLLHYHCKE